jgi:biotin carboxylase
MRVVFLAPAYPAEMPEFTRGLAEVGARVIGVTDQPAAALSAGVRRHLHDHLQVRSLMNEDALVEDVVRALRGREPDRVETLWEPLVVAAARIREALGVPGMSVDTVRAFRDKQLMKERIAAAGLRVPRAERVRGATEARAAAERIGFPLILKPIAGAGSADTFRVDSTKELEAALQRMGHVQEASCEEFVEGREFTYDTICVDGVPLYENVAQYLPRPLVARSNEWISPVICTVRDLHQPALRGGITLGRQVLQALGMGTGFTHMEWYLKDDGEVVFGEIGARVGGARLVDQMNHTSELDLYREWARAVVHGHMEGPIHWDGRKYNCAIVFKRAQGQGRIRSIAGLERFLQRHGQWVVDDTLLRPGQQRRDWTATLVSDGYLMARHPEWAGAMQIAADAARHVHLFAGG